MLRRAANARKPRSPDPAVRRSRMLVRGPARSPVDGNRNPVDDQVNYKCNRALLPMRREEGRPLTSRPSIASHLITGERECFVASPRLRRLQAWPRLPPPWPANSSTAQNTYRVTVLNIVQLALRIHISRSSFSRVGRGVKKQIDIITATFQSTGVDLSSGCDNSAGGAK